VIQDQIIYGDILYGRLTHDFGYMDDRDYETYRAHFDCLRPLLRLPDVIISLEADIKTLQGRINERGRSSEKAIADEYLQRQSVLFRAWADEVSDQTKVIKLDWNAYQPIDEVVTQVEKALDIQLRLPVVEKSPAV
jgi:deoxyadenosine/deoxycytidine kinase